MRFILLSRNVPEIDRSSVRAENYRVIDQMLREGFFEHIWVRDDGYGSVAVINAASDSDALARLMETPFFKSGCVEIELLTAIQLPERHRGAPDLSAPVAALAQANLTMSPAVRRGR